MSDVQRLKEQLFQISNEGKVAIGGLQALRLRFISQGDRVQGLIAGTSSGIDQHVAQLMDEAVKSVERAVEALSNVSNATKHYGETI